MSAKIISIIALAATAFAVPQGPVQPVSANINYWEGPNEPTGYSAVEATCGAANVGSGTISAGQCVTLTNQAIGISGQNFAACTFTLYQGNDACSGSGQVTTIAQGSDEVTCIQTTVEDGGEHYHASGIYTCNN